MTTVFERVNAALTTLNPAVPYALAPFLSSGSLPNLFIAYSLIISPPEQHADDVETERGHRVQLSIYSTDGLTSLPDTDSVMLTAGFQKGPIHQLPKDPNTGHFGLAREYSYLEDV